MMSKYVNCYECVWFWPQKIGVRVYGKCVKTGKLITQTVRKCQHFKPKRVVNNG